MYYYFRKLILGFIRLYSLLAVCICAVVLAVCLWIAYTQEGYELYLVLRPGSTLALFVFHIWLLYASDIALSRRSTLGQHNTNHAVRIRVY